MKTVSLIASGMMIAVALCLGLLMLTRNLARVAEVGKNVESTESRLDCLDSCEKHCTPARTAACIQCVDFCNREVQ